jgi:hypothetical protein
MNQRSDGFRVLWLMLAMAGGKVTIPQNVIAECSFEGNIVTYTDAEGNLFIEAKTGAPSPAGEG